MLISVIMNCFNGERFLKEAIDSVFAQTHRDWEIVFVDDCSTDSSAGIARSYEATGRLTIVRTTERSTLYAARNFGIDHARGEFISFLDVDDVWQPQTLKRLVSRMGPETTFVYGGWRCIDADGNALQMERIPRRRGIVVNSLLLRSFIAVSCILLRADICRRERFDPYYILMGDYDLWIRLGTLGCACDFVALPLLLSRIHDNNISLQIENRWIVEQRHFYRNMLRRRGLRYPMILGFILKYEISHLVGRSSAPRPRRGRETAQSPRHRQG